MKPGPIEIIKCPNCSTKYKKRTLISGNTFGARYWSDGFFDAPMLPNYPAIIKCNNCNDYFWVSDTKVIDQIYCSSSDERYANLSYIEDLHLHEVYEAIELGLGDTIEKEIHLRMKYWHKCNDAFRYEKKSFTISTENEELIDNLYSLTELLDNNRSDQRIIKAEIYRELGMFIEAKELLMFKFLNRYIKTVSFLVKLVDDSNQAVIEIVD